MTSPEQILPDLPDSADARELRFHLRSLQPDLAATAASLKAYLPLPAGEPDAMWQLRGTLTSATAAIEHNAEHHAPRVLELMYALAGEEHRERPPGESVPRSQAGEGDDPFSSPLVEVMRAQLTGELGVVMLALDEAQTLLVELMAKRGSNVVVWRDLADRLVGMLRDVASPAVSRCLTLAVALHHIADPDAAAAEARDQELATPLREISLEGARSLQTCPHCGAPLGRGDRTFTGSYCENCRTRYFEPAQRTDST